MSEGFLRRGAERWLRLCPIGILVVIAVDLILRGSGIDLCRACGDTRHHVPIALGGAVAWSAYLLASERLHSGLRLGLLGGLAGTHLALTAALLATPRWCTSCIATTLLAVSAFVVACSVQGRRIAFGIAGLIAMVVVTHLLMLRA